MAVILKNQKNFDIAQIARSGQCFRLKEHPQKEHTWQLVAYKHYLEIKQLPGSSTIEFDCTQNEFEQLWKRYFDLDTNYQYYIDHIDPEDTYLTAAAAAGAGIRILRQEPWEMLISFTISQNNNIPRIKQSIELLCSIHGKGHITEDGQLWYEFPEPEELTNIEWLQGLGLGYRDKYIQKMAENVAAGTIDLQRLADEEMTDGEIESYLKSIYGIGPKVANCIMLFGYHRIDSVPKDTWINKIIKEQYNGKFPVEMYAGFAGVIQQYIFNYAANKNLREVEE